jgi:GNAT superfamily N-acetyltransferase
MISLRPAVAADAAFIAESLIAIARTVRERAGSPYNAHLPEAVTPREFDYALAFLNADKLALIATDGDARVGCLLAEISESAVPTLQPGKTGTIAACWVAPDFRRQGTGRLLAERAEAWFRRQGVRFAELAYGADSETAGHAWAAQGYAPFRVLSVKDLGGPQNPAPPNTSL